MRLKFENLIKSVFLSSVASIISTNGVKAVPYNLSYIDNDEDKLLEENKKNDLSKKYI